LYTFRITFTGLAYRLILREQANLKDQKIKKRRRTTF
jgi:hypothetical protein